MRPYRFREAGSAAAFLSQGHGVAGACVRQSAGCAGLRGGKADLADLRQKTSRLRK